MCAQILVLGWCVSQRDVEVVRKVVQQVCVAHAPEGGTTVSKAHCVARCPQASMPSVHCAALVMRLLPA